ncbi:MAG: hypothetical protein KDK70_23485 [Myxococcales bacterium]|nr:hypothetical protein [Myxococcales bacterium]
MSAGLGIAQACVLNPDPNHCANNGQECGTAMVCDPCTSTASSAMGCVPVALAKCPEALETSTIGPTDAGTLTTTGPTTTINPTEDVTIGPETTMTDTDTDSTTGPPPPCDEPDGTYGETCTGNNPFCVGGQCVPCNNGVQLTTCDEAPLTVCADSGACVLCSSEEPDACTGGTPVCDDATHTCVRCSEHAQCGPSACNLFTGACVGGMVVDVGGGLMFTTLGAAVAAVGAGGGGTIIVHAGTYNETITVSGDEVAFLANPGDGVEWQRTMGAGAPQLRVTGGATVLIDEIEFRGNTSVVDAAVRVDGNMSRLWMDRSTMAQNAGVAVSTEGSGELVLRNCFVAGANDLATVNVETNATADLQYTTVGANLGNAVGLVCDGSGPVTASDSIILSRGMADVDCVTFTADHSAGNSMLPGTDNVSVGATSTTWFGGYSTGDFHLSGAGQDAIMEIGEWNEGNPLDDPSVDIDGDPRAGVEGMMEFPGADLP